MKDKKFKMFKVKFNKIYKFTKLTIKNNLIKKKNN